MINSWYRAAKWLASNVFSEHHPGLAKNTVFFDNRHFSPTLVETARRSFEENDGPPSFAGAPAGWDCARFFGLILNFGSFPFASPFLPSPGITSCWAVPCITLIMPKGITKYILVSTL